MLGSAAAGEAAFNKIKVPYVKVLLYLLYATCPDIILQRAINSDSKKYMKNLTWTYTTYVKVLLYLLYTTCPDTILQPAISSVSETQKN